MDYDPRSNQVGGRVDRAADDAVGVHHLQVEAVELATLALEVPPGNAVLGADHRGAVAERGAEALNDRWHAVRLKSDKDGVYAAKYPEVVGALRIDGEFLIALDD